ncbi:MAG: class I SAM-dependent methyltransferase [Sphingorhabdus sp.]|uniref:class I SAM-dependent methyltransferase n=1 Tax=Sphingorhabdus sp. TaxID=1902408 RepID=UPI0038FD3772
MNKSLFLAMAATLISVPACADHHEMNKAEHDKMHKAHQERLAKILVDPSRAEDSKRDKYRHPAETFDFFRLHPDHVIGEYAPGGEWISRILGKYVDEKGKFNGLYFSTDAGFGTPESHARIKASAAKFGEDVAKVTGRPATDYAGFTLDAIPEGAKGTYDRILLMRMVHNLIRFNIVDTELKRMRELLKDDGLIGIEQHRAKADAPYSYSNGNMGYLREADVINLMEINGFELVGKSEINANPKDSANWPDGVWTLPPQLTLKDQDRAKYEAIGESDRMTLLFKKRP